MTNLKWQQNRVNKIFNPTAFFFIRLDDITNIYIVFTYFASFTGYTDDIFKVFFYLHIHGSNIGRKMDQDGGKSKKNWTSRSLWSLFFLSLPLGPFGLVLVVTMSMCTYSFNFLQGLSLALRSHDQIPASQWVIRTLYPWWELWRGP